MMTVAAGVPALKREPTVVDADAFMSWLISHRHGALQGL
jgi:hypothetical protein